MSPADRVVSVLVEIARADAQAGYRGCQPARGEPPALPGSRAPRRGAAGKPGAPGGELNRNCDRVEIPAQTADRVVVEHARRASQRIGADDEMVSK